MKDVWNAMSYPTRRAILSMLRTKDMTAGEISDQFEISGATVSHHLKILREAGLVISEKEKQTITYSLNTTVFQDFLKGIADMFGTKGENQEKSSLHKALSSYYRFVTYKSCRFTCIRNGSSG